jgi:hypothetical protein
MTSSRHAMKTVHVLPVTMIRFALATMFSTFRPAMPDARI